MFVKMSLGINELILYNRDGYTFENLGVEQNTTVTIRQPTKDESNFYPCRSMIDVTLKTAPNENVKLYFERLELRKIEWDKKRAQEGFEKSMGMVALNSDEMITFSQLSDEIQSFIKNVYVSANNTKRLVVSNACWRCGAAIDNVIYLVGRQIWSLDSQNWYWMPADFAASNYFVSELNIPSPVHSDLVEVVIPKETFPLAHELWGDAWHQQYYNPHIALITGVSALEAGAKSLITKFVPGSEWLVKNLQSPPVDKIFAEYAPEINHLNNDNKIEVRDIRGHGTSLKISVYQTLKNSINERNGIVHGTTRDVKNKYDVRKFLLVVRDVLYWCDYKCDEQWALEHIRPEVREALLNKEKRKQNDSNT